ncbi:MAG: insulinase family protein [Opitutaceae bacterium]
MRTGSLVLVTLLAAAVHLPVTAAPVLPPPVKAPTDTAVFRRFTLDNGLRVLLVSDPKFNKSGASLVMNTGQIDDPADREGMAHFLEHMLFLGTEKYPDVSDYGNFIKANGGYNNAYTTTDHTNYQFEVRHEAFADALDRFAQFFIAPRFNPEFTAREIFAVHNEAMRHLQNDFRRLIGVSRELYAPGSGESKFSTGNKDTLAGTTPAMVRAFYESHYSADRMALALAGKASLDELEKLARTLFAAVPRRDLPPVARTAVFLPKKAALRLARIEPVKELRQITLEFVVPPTRPDFASKPDQLLPQLISYPGEGGLLAWLKRQDLANSVNAYVWERTEAYGSLQIQVSLTPAGQEQHARVLGLVFSYLDHLKRSPFPEAFYRDRARVAALNETYQDRGEGAELATKLSNQALFYPLDVAERASDVWGAPDEPAYRRLLVALTPDNLLVSLMAKGVPTDRKERIYGTAYSYMEDAGDAYRALLAPERIAAFALPGANPFMPGTTALLAERPLPLIDEPGVALFFAPDTEFQRPQSTLIYRFVPARDQGTADQAALLRLYDACLRDSLDAALGDASLAGLDFSADASLEGYKFTITGFGDSAVRFATFVSSRLRTFELSPGRFEALKEATLRSLRSYPQTEAYLLARDRRDALAREIHFLPDEQTAQVTAATWKDVQAFARTFFARGKLEAVVHGHLTPEDAVKATRTVAAQIGAAPVAPDALLRRRHLALAPAKPLVDAGEIAGANSAYTSDYLLPDDSPQTRAAAVVIGNFMSEPYYTELRTRQQLGYIVGSGAGGSLRQRYLSFTVQSSGYAPDELRRRSEAFLATLPAQFEAVTPEQWATLVAGARSAFEEKPKSMAEKAEQFFVSAFSFGGEWERRQTGLAALLVLKKEDVAKLLATTLAPETARRRTVLLWTKTHAPAEPIVPAFTDRGAWKRTQKTAD